MGKAAKLIENWKQYIPPKVKKQEVITVVNKYFNPEQIRFGKGGSHNIIITDKELIGIPNVNYKGEFIIAINGGKEVKGWYIETLIDALKILGKDC